MIEKRRREFRDNERLPRRRSSAGCGDTSVLRPEFILTGEERAELKKRIMDQL